MSKLIFLLIVVAIVYVLLRARASRRPPAGGPSSGGVASEAFVACARCGVNVPLSEALTFDGRSYCCEEHRRLG